MEIRPPSPAHRAFLACHWVLIAIVLVCVVIEMMLQGADFGLLGSPRWRGLVYQNGGFWRGLLDNWQPNYAAQPAVMFAATVFCMVASSICWST